MAPPQGPDRGGAGPAPASSADGKPRSSSAIHNLPPPNPDFVGREGPLAELRRLLTAGQGPAVLTQAITGLGGIGKTQTARAYGHRHLADYHLVWWLRAETPATLAADYATLAAPLGLDPAEPDHAKLTAAIRDALPDLAPCLLVFDNVEDPLLPRAYLPRAGAHVLITSRRTDWRGIARPLALELMPEAEALQLLTGRPDPETLAAADLAEAEALTADLGHLPLALAQAAAYLHECAESFAGYRELLRTSRPVVLAEGRPDPDYPEPVARTWDVSIRAAEAACPAARPLLEMLAFFAPDVLPRWLLDADDKALPEGLDDRAARNRAIAALGRFSLIRAELDGVSVHRLVQAVTQDALDGPTAGKRAEVAVRLIKSALPGPFVEHRNWPAISRLAPHALAAADAAEQLEVGLEAAQFVLNGLGLYFKERANLNEAERLYERALIVAEKALGPEHPDTVSVLNNLALLYSETGRHAKAEPLFLRTIEIGEKTLGPDHPDLAVRLNNLAVLYQDTARLTKAKPLFLRALAITEKTFGPDHPVVAIRLNNLASLYAKAGRPAKAEPLFERALAIRFEALGPEHPLTAQSFHNLAEYHIERGLADFHRPKRPAAFRRAKGRLAKAEPLLARAVTITEKTLGPDHPDLATYLMSLAGLYQNTGRLIEAERVYKRALKIAEQALPPDHPRRRMILESHADFLGRLGRADEAAALRVRGPR